MRSCGPALLLLACGRSDAPAAPPATPVILISLDTCRSDRLAPYGGSPDTSPVLARLAAESVTFTDCLAQSSNTGPSHRSLFTGQFVHRHGHRLQAYTRSPYTLAGLLHAAGYQTAGFTGGGFLDPGLGFDQGFDVYKSKNDSGPSPVRRGFQAVLPQAEGWYAQRDPSRPFFLFLHTYDIHCPYWPAQPWRERFQGNYQGSLDLKALCGWEAFASLFEGGKDLPEEDRDYLQRMYDGNIAMADELLGRFLDRLRADGTLDRSLLIVLSDHGESLGEHRWVGHNQMWEEQLQVPLLIRFPGAAHAGTICDAPVMLIDVLPTILDYLQLPAPPGVQGESLLPVLDGARQFPERLRISEHLDQVSFRFDDRWKLILSGSGSSCFDLQADPGETRALQDAQPGLLARYQEFRAATAAEDQRFRGAALADPIDEELARQLTELGYADFEPQ